LFSNDLKTTIEISSENSWSKSRFIVNIIFKQIASNYFNKASCKSQLKNKKQITALEMWWYIKKEHDK